MLVRLKKIFTSVPIHLGLIPLFCFTHTLNQFYHPRLIPDVLWLSLLYTSAGLLVSLLLKPLMGDFNKSSLLTGTLLCIQFFTGSLHDTSRHFLPGFFLNKYSILIPAILLALLIVLYLIRKQIRNPGNLLLTANSIFSVLLLTEIPVLAANTLNQNKLQTAPVSLQRSSTRPDVYILLADEYAGHQVLKEKFGFDNSRFENELASRGFWVGKNTRSNYNATVYSMASFLNLGYLDGLNRNKVHHQDMLACRYLIEQSQLTNWFIDQGYEIGNHSPFDIAQTKKLYKKTFFFSNRELLSFHLFTSRIYRQLGFHLHKKENEDLYYRQNNEQNEKTLQATIRHDRFSGSTPRFVYAHFGMPHHPYLYDSTGRPVDINHLKSKEWKYDKNAYISYLVYCNKKLLGVCDSILKNSRTAPVILVMSDHGYRQYREKVNDQVLFENLFAVLTPDKNYKGLYPGMSNVNIMRQVLNNQFDQHLPLLADTCNLLTED